MLNFKIERHKDLRLLGILRILGSEDMRTL